MAPRGNVLTTSKTTIVGDQLASVVPRNPKPWFMQSNLLSLNLRLLIPLLSSAALGFDGSMMNGLQSVENWKNYFSHPSGSLLGLMNAVNPLGGLFACLVAGWISDRIGRKKTIALGATLMCIAAAIQAAAQNFAMFIIARLLIGIAMQTASMPSPVLITEMAYPTHLAKMTGLFNTFYYVGAIASSWTVFGTFAIASSTWSWRIPSLLQAFFPVIQLLCIYFVPESPRWLIKKGRADEAKALFVKYHAAGDEFSPLVAYEMEEIERHLQAEAEIESMGWSLLYRTKADRKRLFIIIFIGIIAQWAGNGIISYYIFLVLQFIGITSSFKQTLINGILQIVNAIAAWFGAAMCDRLGRRALWLWSALGMLASYIAFTACSAVFAHTSSHAAGNGVLAFIFIYYIHYDIALTPFLFGYPAEILPFHTRQKGISIVGFITNVALMFNLYVNPIAMDAISWRYYIVYIIILVVIVLVIFFFFPETRGHSLEAIADIFEGNTKAWKSTTAFASGPDGEKGAYEIETTGGEEQVENCEL